jgi:hypothetical protein
MHPWRYFGRGISIALRMTPRGGRDDIDPAMLGDSLRKLTAAEKD